MAQDIRNRIFRHLEGRKYVARISSEGEGVVSGIEWLRTACIRLGIDLKGCRKSGTRIRRGDIIAVIEGRAKQLALAEEELIGWISKASGIATAARRARKAAGKRLQIVSGAWKKMPPPVKELIRQAALDGGIQYRISRKPFLYLDKNYLKMFGGVQEALDAVRHFGPYVNVVQLKSKGKKLIEETALAARGGAGILMIDTGRRMDVERVDRFLREQRMRQKIRLAFAGNIRIGDLHTLKKMPLELVDIGKAIVDAPLLDMRMDVEA